MEPEIAGATMRSKLNFKYPTRSL